MGYRSDVALALTREGCRKLQIEIASARGKEVEAARKLLANYDNHLCDSDTGAELWYWVAVKWYDDYPDVAFIENFISRIADEDDYRFMRIGEDMDDVEVRGDFFEDPFDLRIARTIEFAVD